MMQKTGSRLQLRRSDDEKANVAASGDADEPGDAKASESGDAQASESGGIKHPRLEMQHLLAKTRKYQ